MPLDLLVVIAAGLVVLQMAAVFLRRSASDERPYLVLLAVDLALLMAAHASGRDDSAWAFVAEVMALVLTLTPRFFERREVRAVESGELAAARRWAILRELVVPGRGATRRRRQLEDLIEVRARGSQAVVRRLRDELARAHDPQHAEALHEELVALLLVDQRQAEAGEHFARHLGAGFLLRRPGLLPQLVRAYGELGQLEEAAALLALVESSALSRDPMLFPIVQRARLWFLAQAGATGVLTAILDGPSGLVLPEAEREQLLKTSRARALAGVAPSLELQAALRFETSRASEWVRARARRSSPATWTLIALNVAAFLAALLLVPGAAGVLLQDAQEGAPLARAGALFRPAVMAGEWWRAVTAMFLHGGLLHLGLNMYGLFLLGRFVEDLAGSLRFFIIYFLAGLAGAAATTLVGKAALSVGASGAIMGLLGALIIVLILRRGSFPEQWRRVLLWNLVLLAGLQIYIGFTFPMIDNAAHIGGLVGGAAAAVVFAPGLLVGMGRIGREIVRWTAAVCVAIAVVALIQVARTSLPKTLARIPEKIVQVDGAQLTVPRHWQIDGEKKQLVDPYLDLEITVHRQGDTVEVTSPEEKDSRYSQAVARVRSTARPAP